MGSPPLHALQDRLPMPLAQLCKRALRSDAPSDRHHAAFYLAEASVKLAASARIGRWLDRGCTPGGDLAKRLEGLLLPSLGHWCGWFRDVSAALAALPDAAADPLALSAKALAKKRELRAVAAFARAAAREQAVGGSVADQAEKRGLVGFFDLLVAYRNEVVGHGAQRSQRFYAELADLLIDALAEVLALPEILGGLSLALPRLSTTDGKRAQVRWTELHGLGGAPSDGPDDVNTGELYLLGEGGYRVALQPLVVYAEDDHGGEHFGFLNRATKARDGAAVKRADYLDYLTGKTLEDVDAVAVLTGMLGKLRGEKVDTDAVRHTMLALATDATAQASGASGGVPQTARDAPDSTAMAGTVARVGEVIAERYRLVSRLGEGGMGVVFEAEHLSLGRRYAVKMLRPELSADEKLVERFEREAREAAASRHPGIVDVIDLGRAASGAVFMVMELLEGESLAERMNHGVLPIDEAVDIAAQALDALGAAHARGVVHRDVKPDNLFVTRDVRGERLVKVLDFGIAKVASGNERLTAAGIVLGTPLYMSPEQIRRGGDVDARADVYSMGATLHHMLTGSPAVEGGSMYDVVARVVAGEISRDPRGLRPEVPTWLAEAVARALETDPSERFESAAAMRAALLAGGAVQFASDRADASESSSDRAGSAAGPAVAPAGRGATEHATPAMVDEPAPKKAHAAAPLRIPIAGAASARARRSARMSRVIAAVTSLAALGAGLLYVATRRGDPAPSAAANGSARPAGSAATPPLPATTAPHASAAPRPSAPEGMVRVDGARFTFGATPEAAKLAEAACVEGCTSAMFERETPAQEVEVSAFFIDAREVDNGAFAAWLATLDRAALESAPLPPDGRVLSLSGDALVAIDAPIAGLATAPAGLAAGGVVVVPGHEAFAVVGATWLAAERYCEAQGKRLPAEAEWELAARGVALRSLPWGDAPPTCGGVQFGRYPSVQRPDVAARPDLARRHPCFAEPAGPSEAAMPQDRTPEGIEALGGNAREWVLDAFDEAKPQHAACPAPCRDPGRDRRPGAPFRVLRGGGWHEPAVFLRTTRRSYAPEQEVDLANGFRCARPDGGSADR